MRRNHKGLNVLLIEPFYGGSHRQWADGLRKHSAHQIDLITLPARHWKWRMHGAAVTFAERLKTELPRYDLILTTDMLDLATFRGITKTTIPVIAYFHENQFAYPWSHTDPDPDLQRDRHYMWINLTTAIAADRVWFNSGYNRNTFLKGVKVFLRAFPDHQKIDLKALQAKSSVVPLGLELKPFLESSGRENDIPVILWNHRWEYDKNPDLFFNTMMAIKEEGLNFRLCVLGEKAQQYPTVFDRAREDFADRIFHFGPVSSRHAYISLVAQCDILPVTSNQDFFGISVVEAVAAGVSPLLPERLAYGEHLAPDLYSDCYYTGTDMLLQKCRKMLNRTHRSEFRSQVARYDWSKMIETYDQGMEEAVG